ncbi:5-methyltetrahydropteroyltriglutamate--homocysteine S-methyltransferase [Actinobacillus pleuropneumoniae]|uniref:5-methyltetrahydropteroyltriglutamate--homocysteine methyltransferase n=1 Tax=Actinobacillus pleuropneumoniae serotype 7 (strain AP76) TaxID=537457 RepID=METE_ACTP7|nr:5-methyltetrahydropteroyltriglutamate--homocysteine S-methyltransferase [Actinobacillus pleuropneumoniae]B3GY43.1 RecName: Full=5-methyltetrahydropteroyltriglutamate--homocysteine methyltransferase; AltName: Full=Cobalamin-independent methionine synthase; AltName: Full=Methionine synthase, vitamin-B12 independent isozyme [Actinobacillus pleuropneumoniae serovar 7 str. AP76]ACE61866.1 5-methyltetrahydropteroyltriglutamate-- homocysteine methyltransferase [Actinobacillus pleuropneumoniae serovar
MTTLHILGFPRVGAKRELKFAQERYWRKELAEQDLLDLAKALREKNWLHQAQADADFVTVGDFTFYDHILDLQVATGAIPARFGFDSQTLSLDQYFQLARGNKEQFAIEMTKWFDTNYHYLVPEFQKNTTFKANPTHYVNQIREAKAAGHQVKPVIVGPLTFLWLGKEKGEAFNRFDLLKQLVPIYFEILTSLAAEGVEWIQIDEPALALDLPQEWLAAYQDVYAQLAKVNAKLLLATYFGSVAEHADLLKALPVDGLHLDLVRAPEQLSAFEDYPKVLSAGVIDGRNIWRANLNRVLDVLEPLKAKFNQRLWIAPSCSLLHTPYDLAVETQLQQNNPELYRWLAFTLQKVAELQVLKQALNAGRSAVAEQLNDSQTAADARANSNVIHKAEVAQRLANLPTNADKRQSPFAERIKLQNKWLNLPLLPTTNIGSFPQTLEIRHARAAFKKGELSLADYEAAMKKEIEFVVRKQEELDLDVLVHGEAERNDMVEYFGELLDGFAFTKFGWVQSYGSRCVKPPVIYGDVTRPEPMTVRWSQYAQSLTDKVMKGMLTGPVTILQWSFVRNDIPRSTVCKQIGVALSDEVLDLEKAGIKVIQIDEPAIREGLPLKRADWDAYLQWAGEAFRLSYMGVKDDTQIHTHMCYSEFNDILPAIAGLDADVITIETSRSDMELLTAFADFKYPNDIGPGVYDIHSPRVPTAGEIEHLLRKALKVIPKERLWVNPDCGLKTRGWKETIEQLQVMVEVTKKLRAELAE